MNRVVNQDALDFLKEKKVIPSEEWYDFWQGEHSHIFTVAHSHTCNFLDKIHEYCNAMVEKGLSIDMFKNGLKKHCEKNGWYGGRVAPTIKEGDSEEVKKEKQEKYLNWRLEIIAKTNCRTAYMAGKYQEMMRGARLRPVWVYEAVMDGATRAKHKELNNKAFWYDHPFWDTYFPPNDWGCRCSVVSLTESAATNRGLNVTKSDQEVKIKDDFAPPEWRYNVAKHKWSPDWSKYRTLNRVKVKDGNNKDAVFTEIIKERLKESIENEKIKTDFDKLKPEQKAIKTKSLLKKLGNDNEVFKKHFDIKTELIVKNLNENNNDPEKMILGACRPDKKIALDISIATDFYMALKKLEANVPLNKMEIYVISDYIHERVHYLQYLIDPENTKGNNLTILEGMTELMGRLLTAEFLKEFVAKFHIGIDPFKTLHKSKAYVKEVTGIRKQIRDMGKASYMTQIIYSFTDWTRSKDYKPKEAENKFKEIVKSMK